MSVFNEEDIIEEAVQKMIQNGVDVFVLDNGCTDGSIAKIQKFVGKGVVDIFHYVTIEDGRKVFKLADILDQFQKLSSKLNYDWYLISDADEIKLSPWRDCNLSEGIDKVDKLGYNLINFKF
jgi:glycosyltransferase involved in cell wall biosynthesis